LTAKLDLVDHNTDCDVHNPNNSCADEHQSTGTNIVRYHVVSCPR